MIRLTKFSLKRPVTLVLALLTFLFFGLGSVLNAPMELTPDMEMPMMLVTTAYPGASPLDINELICKKIEAEVSTLNGIDTVNTYAMENVSMVWLQYEYGTNMDKAYINLKKALDNIAGSMPEDAKDSVISEIKMNRTEDVVLSISGGTDGNLYDYVDSVILPEFEKLSSVGQVTLSGGQKGYIRVELDPVKMAQYHLTMTSLANLLKSASFTLPAGTVDYGRQNLTVSIGADYKDIERIKNIVLPLPGGEVICLSDVARVYDALEEKNTLSRYNGEDVVSISIVKQQSFSAVDVSRAVKGVIEELEAANPSLKITVISQTADNIISSIRNVFQTLIMAVVLSMIILFIFFGDIKASLIVGSSIPVSVMIALTLMRAAGFSMNLISIGSLVLGVGMIVDASIVVLESCFRSKENRGFYEAAMEGTRIVIGSITGSTATTCVVFIPLALLQGLSGQLFRQLGYTIVFCMVASLFSAVMIVPLLYHFIHPIEKQENLASRILAWVQDAYRETVGSLLPKKKTVIFAAVVLLIISFVMASQVGVVLMPTTDQGSIAITAKVQPGIKTEEAQTIASRIEAFVQGDPDVENYQMTYGTSIEDPSDRQITLVAYLKKKRSRSTAKIIEEWQPKLVQMPDTSVTVKNHSENSSNSTSTVEIDLQSTDYQKVKEAADDLVMKLRSQPYLLNIHSYAENAAPVVKIDVDPLQAESIGMTPSAIAGMIYQSITGVDVMEYSSNNQTITVKMKYPKEEYDTIEDIKGMLIPGTDGTLTPVSQLAEVSFQDSARVLVRRDKKYQVAITADKVAGYKGDANREANAYVDSLGLPPGVEKTVSSYNEIMNREMRALMNALITAVFLIFIVMAIQFESPRFSLMVMFTIPFALIGAFGLLWLFDVSISMNSMLGFLMMVGTVVNNGILYVDTVNQYKLEMPLDTALVEAGATRIRPILMTTLTTVISMLPMAAAYGENGEVLQALALVNVGGLIASTLLSLLLLPTLYRMLDRAGKKIGGVHPEGLEID